MTESSSGTATRHEMGAHTTLTDSRRWSSPLAWGLGAFSLLGYAGFTLFGLLRHETGAGSRAASGLVLVGLFTVLGTLLALRQPANPIGWLMTVGGLTAGVNSAARSIVTSALEDGREVSSALSFLAVFGEWIWPLSVLCSIGLPLLLFPDGRVRSARWNWVLRAMLLGAAVAVISGILTTEPIYSEPVAPLISPWAVAGLASWTDAGVDVGGSLLLIPMVIALAGIVIRGRSASGTERQQLRWVSRGAVLAVVGFAVYPVAEIVDLPGALVTLVSALGFACLPLSVAVAALRYRLYDLDRVVSRTVTYGVLTGLLVASYAGLVTAVSRLTPSSSSLAVASSTLAVAALFQPLRRWLQGAVDRRFNRARYDAAHTVEEFSLRLRDEVDLEAVRADLVGVVRQTMQPDTVLLWLRDTSRVTS